MSAFACQGNWRRANYILCVGPGQSILPFTRKTSGGPRHAQGARRGTAVGPPPSKKNSPELFLESRQRLSRDRPASCRPAHRFEMKIARQPFRRCIVPGTTRKHANASPTALQGTRPASQPASTQATLPLCGVSITRLTRPRTGDQPGCRRGSCVSHVLCFALHVAIRCYPEGPGSYAWLFRTRIVCTMMLMVISGDRT